MDLAITQRPCIVLRKGSRVITIPSNSNQIGIASGTLRLKRSIVDTDIEFGVPIASEFSVELFNIEEDLRGWEIEVSLKDTTQPVPIYTALFTGVIDSSKTDNIGHTRQIVAYDWIYYHRDDNVASWWNNYWQPATGYSIKTVRNAFLQYLGFTTPTKSYVNDTDSIISWSSDDLPIMSTITVGQVLKMLCEMQGTFPFIDPFGNLDFATLDDTYTVDITGQYETGNSTWEDFTTDTITGVSLYSSSEDLLTSVGTVDNVYNIAGNIWLMHLEDYYHDNVITVLTNLLNFIDDIQYKPCNIKMIKSNINLYLGQRVLTDRGYTYVMSNELSGVCFVEQTIQGISSASKLPKEVSDANDTMVQENKLSKTYSEINQMKDRIVLKVDADGRIVQAELSADPSTGTEFKVSADNIDFIANGVMNLTANAIGINASNFSVDKDTGNITCNGGTIGGWRIYNTGFSYGMVSPSDYSHTGAFLDSTGSIIFSNVGNDNHTILNDEGLKVYKTSASSGELGSFTSNYGFVIPSGYSTRNFTGTAIVLGCSEDNTSTISNAELRLSPIEMTLAGASAIGYSNKGISHFYGIYDDGWTNDTVPIISGAVHRQLVSSSVTTTELGYLSGASSNIQTQLNGKQATITGGATTITSSNLTTNRALVSNSSGKVAVSTATSTELGYVHGVTSNIQTQLDSKANKAHIYGAEWDGSSTTKWTRTDDSQYFVEPQPAVNNGNGFSPFDNIYPWAGMVIIEDATAGTLVSIPKFWYKWTRDGAKMKLQIADAPVDGFLVSPAHMNRGDGAGERDVVYVGRYHSASDYKSKTGVIPLGNKTRSEFREALHTLGSDLWLADYAMLWTIRMLYLVEYADWNSQAVLGYGCGDVNAVRNVGSTDNMIYHTGTSKNKGQYGLSVQYRHIEGLWDNVFDFWDGIYYSGTSVYGILNPNKFSDTQNGTFIGTRPLIDSMATAWFNPNVSGFEWALFPSAGGGAANTYITDTVNFRQSGVVHLTGGFYSKAYYFGLFFSGGDTAANGKDSFLCSRLMKLP